MLEQQTTPPHTTHLRRKGMQFSCIWKHSRMMRCGMLCMNMLLSMEKSSKLSMTTWPLTCRGC